MKKYINLQDRGQSFASAWRGLTVVFQREINFRIHTFLMLCVLGLGWWLKLNTFEWVAVLLVIGLVLVAELANTAVENVCDLIYTEHHLRIKDAKDVGAGLVLVAVLLALIVGGLVFVPKLATLFY